MKLKKFLKIMDPIIQVEIFNQIDEEPVFHGCLMDVPWGLANKEIGRADNSKEEPIFITERTNEYGVKLPCITINIIE